jgi:hypothetical protein
MVEIQQPAHGQLMIRQPVLLFVLVVLCPTAGLLPPTPLAAQRAASGGAPPDTAGAFMDGGAASLLNRARDARLATDRSLRSYTAIVRSRTAAGLRMPLKDRTLFRQETAVRARWSRDAGTIVQMLGGRAQSPEGVSPAAAGGFGVTDLFDPTQDRLSFGMSLMSDTARQADDFWIEHPLGISAERHYRYRSGDTLTIRLQDGREVRVVELHLIPRRSNPQTVRGMLWIDASGGAVVQAAFRLARTVDIMRDMDVIDDEDSAVIAKMPFLTPMEFDISLLTLEYGLWEMQHWLPRTMRLEGLVRVGIMRVPFAADVSYTMLDVMTDGAVVDAEEEADAVQRTLLEWGAEGEYRSQIRKAGTDGQRRQYHVLTPTDRQLLLRSESLPAPIWSDAPGFATEAELRQIADRLAGMAGPMRPDLAVRLTWGRDELDLVRYNRVEALSLGARATVPLPWATLSATARLGAGDLQPNAELLLSRETMRRTLELRGYHELATVDESRHALGAGNTLSALLFGRDEGEYFRATGATLTVAPPATARRSWEVRTYAERHAAAERNTHVAIPRMWRDSVFRPNIRADEAWQYGAMVLARPWWGADPHRAQFGVDAMLQAESGDFELARGSLTLRGAVPLGTRTRIGAEAGAGTAVGDVPVQRYFFLGGASTLRGYEASTVAGTSMARSRLEIARTTPFANLAIFSDWGWAGDRDSINRENYRWSLGAGASLLDGVIRLDLARGMRAPRGWRLDLYLDALL